MISVNLRLLSGFAGPVWPLMASFALINGQAKGSTIFRLDQVVFRKRAQNFLELDIVGHHCILIGIVWSLLDGEILDSLIVFRLLGIRSFHGCCKVIQKHNGFRSKQDGPS